MSDTKEVANKGKQWTERLMWMLVGTVLTLVTNVTSKIVEQRFVTPIPPSSPSPRLVYRSIPPEKGAPKRYVVKFWNAGDKRAEDVRIAIAFPKLSKLKESLIEPSAGLAAKYDLEKRSNAWLVHFPTLVPRESCSVSLWMEGVNDSHALEVSMVSNDGLALTTPPGPSPPGALTVTMSNRPFREEYSTVVVTIVLGIAWLFLEERQQRLNKAKGKSQIELGGGQR